MREVADRSAIAAGMGHNAAAARRQSAANIMAAKTRRRYPVPSNNGMTWENTRSWSEQSFMMTLVTSAKSRLPKNESGSKRRRSAIATRLRALSRYTARNVASYCHAS